MPTNIRKKSNQTGLTLIELIVAIFIFSIITVAIVSVFVSVTRAHQKARSMKFVKENAEFAISSIAKDVRMGRIESPFRVGGTTHTNNGTSRDDYFAVSRNRNQAVVCYHVTGAYLGVAAGTGGDTGPPLVLPSCPSDNGANYDKIVDFSGTEMSFDTGALGTAGFYSLPTDMNAPGMNRGWVEINLNIKMTSGKEMEADSINVQTVVSSRDYGWEDVN